jgi:predicted transcriptional regulator
LGLVEEDVALSQGKRPLEVKYYKLTQKGKNFYENIVHLLNILKVSRKNIAHCGKKKTIGNLA